MADNWSANWKTCRKRSTVLIQCPKCITGFAWEYYGTGNVKEVVFPNHCPYCGWEWGLSGIVTNTMINGMVANTMIVSKDGDNDESCV